MQVWTRLGQFPPRLPGQQEVEAGAESQFADTEMRLRVVVPALRQIVALEENVATFFEAIVLRVVHIVEGRGYRYSGVVPVQGGWLDRHARANCRVSSFLWS